MPSGVIPAHEHDQPPYGLLSAASVDTPGDDHWVDGFAVETNDCGVNIKTFPTCVSSPQFNQFFDNSGGEPFFWVAGFGILQTLECNNTVGVLADDRRERAVKKVLNATEWSVEKEIWEGVNAQDAAAQGGVVQPSRWLADATDVTPTPGTGVSPRVALGLVEQNFSSNNPGVEVTIHISPLMADALKNGLVEDKGSLYTRNTGARVYINRGANPAVGPHSGGSALNHWIYATGPVHAYLGEEEMITVSLAQAVNTVNNSTIFTAERPAAVWFEGCDWFGALANATL